MVLKNLISSIMILNLLLFMLSKIFSLVNLFMLMFAMILIYLVMKFVLISLIQCLIRICSFCFFVRQPFLGAKLLQIFQIRKFMAKNNVYNITRNGQKFENYELLKSAKLSSGYTVYLFRGTICPKVSNYIVCAKQGDVTVEFHQVMHHMRPFSMYLDLICCYA